MAASCLLIQGEWVPASTMVAPLYSEKNFQVALTWDQAPVTPVN